MARYFLEWMEDIRLFLQLPLHDVEAVSLEGQMTCKQSVEQYTYRIDVRRVILNGYPSGNEFRGGIFHFPHKGAFICRDFGLLVQFLQAGSNAKINQLDFPVGGDHDIGRIDVPVQISGIMHGHDGRQYILDNVRGRLFGSTLQTLAKVLGIVNFLGTIIRITPFQNMVQRYPGEEFAHYVQPFFDKSQATVFQLYEPHHLNQVVVAQLDGSFTIGLLNRLPAGFRVSAGLDFLDGYLAVRTRALIDHPSTEHDTHSALTHTVGAVELIVNLVLDFVFALDFHGWSGLLTGNRAAARTIIGFRTIHGTGTV